MTQLRFVEESTPETAPKVMYVFADDFASRKGIKKGRGIGPLLQVIGNPHQKAVLRPVVSFLPTWNERLEVNHIDGNRHAIIHFLKNDYGEKSSNAKLTNAQAEEIRRLYYEEKPPKMYWQTL